MARTPFWEKNQAASLLVLSLTACRRGIEFIEIPAFFISFITGSDVIHKILEHLNLWEEKDSRGVLTPSKDQQKTPRAV